MSITHELREYFGKSKGMFTDHVLAIADRIDAEHERLMQEQPFTIDMVPITDESMAKHGWIRLPVDADGEPIRVGDMMEERSGHTFEVASLMAFGGSDNWLVLSDAGSFSSFREPHDIHHYRHYHSQTVEDVLRELALAVCKDDALTIRKDVVDEYAAKLRLAGDAE